MWRRIAGGLLEVHRCVRSLHSHTYNFEVTSLGCVRRGPALLYMGVVSLSTGGLVGRGGGAAENSPCHGQGPHAWEGPRAIAEGSLRLLKAWGCGRKAPSAVMWTIACPPSSTLIYYKY